nr:methyltransferase domain-containing protein [Paenibacillus nasutitermitis]
MRTAESGSLICEKRHCFDIARPGYVNFFSGPHQSKYDKQLFEARRLIGETGIFDPVIEIISAKIKQELKKKHREINLLDAGCGEGSHLNSLQEKLVRSMPADVRGVGLDISKIGIQMASKAHPKAVWCVGDLANCPFASGQFQVILNFLSPSNYAEFQRMLAEEGMVVKVVPEGNYLKEIRELLQESKTGHRDSDGRTSELFSRHFKQVYAEQVQYRCALYPFMISPLLQMTPLSWGFTQQQMREIVQRGLKEITVDLKILFGRK